ncbi:MAG TPA: phospholipase D-like domain-containing protein [Longimicrobiales bacterium]|nr:phospholipase D-like domain-containing protein [Longimicrobiales bacterium]
MTQPLHVTESENGVADFFTHAVNRTVNAPLVGGNAVRLLRNAADNYPAWLDAIKAAQRYIYFESYIIYDDDVGRAFFDALTERARHGVCVRLIYDWLGALGKTPGRFWRELERGGVEVRCYNTPRLTSPLGWLRRDHRKLLSVDGQVSFISGLCVGQAWAGDNARGLQPWRDTGVEIRGPAVADVEEAFTNLWAVMGDPVHPDEPLEPHLMPVAGDVAVRIVATTPGTAGLLRVDQLVATSAREKLWLADAYFAGIPTYVQALSGAARDGVDVRLLVPGSSDIAVLRPISMIGYRPLLEAGVRVFEWKGPMMHAKTAVADGRWARVGSSNLNISSWMGNHELDAVIEDVGFAEAMEEMYREDLENATEIVLSHRRGLRRFRDRQKRPPRASSQRARANAGRATAGALRFSSTVAAAITERRVLVPTESKLIAVGGLALLVLALTAALWPRIITIPLSIVAVWLGSVLLAKSLRMRRREQNRGDHS